MVLVFDTETNGLPRNWKAPVNDLSNWPRVVQLAWGLYAPNGSAVQEEVLVIKPDGWVIPEAASSVHGISTEVASEIGVPMEAALWAFIEAYEQAEVLVAHNLAFDRPVLGAEMLRYAAMPENKVPHSVCTMMASTDFCRLPGGRGGQYKWPQLSELHFRLFGEGFDGAHDALVDVQACARCFFELIDECIIPLAHYDRATT